jgi:hypothetical protein
VHVFGSLQDMRPAGTTAANAAPCSTPPPPQKPGRRQRNRALPKRQRPHAWLAARCTRQ